MTEHTPGPWELSPCYGSEDFEVWTEDGWLLARVNESADGEFNGEGNAHLIAAAPELLQAAKNVLSMPFAAQSIWASQTHKAFQELEKAVSKAEGKDKEHG